MVQYLHFMIQEFLLNHQQFRIDLAAYTLRAAREEKSSELSSESWYGSHLEFTKRIVVNWGICWDMALSQPPTNRPWWINEEVQTQNSDYNYVLLKCSSANGFLDQGLTSIKNRLWPS